MSKAKEDDKVRKPEQKPELPSAVAFERFEFYRDSYRKAWNLLFTVTGVLGLSVLMNVIQFNTRAPIQNIGLTPDLRVVEIKPVTNEVYSPSEVINWAARTVPDVYNLNFREFRRQVSGLEPRFTKEGYLSYLAGLEFAKMEKLIVDNSYVVTAAPAAPPRIVGTGQLKGAFFWRIEVPLTVSYASGSNATVQELKVTIVALRVPQNFNPAGIAIHSFVAQRK